MNNHSTRKAITSIILLFISVVVFSENNVSFNLFSADELQSFDQAEQTSPVRTNRQANRFTGLEAGVTNWGTLKIAFSSLKEVNSWFTYGFGLGVRYYTREEKNTGSGFCTYAN